MVIPPTSLDLVVKAQAIAILGIADWLSQRNDVPQAVRQSLLQALTTVPIIVGGDLGSEAELEMKEKANVILTRLIGQPAH